MASMDVARFDSSALHEWDRIAAGSGGAGPRQPPLRAWLAGLVRLAAKVLVVALLPFVALVRVAVFLYEREGWPTTLALAGGALCTTVVVTTYGVWAWHHFTGRVRLGLVARRISMPLVVAYSAYALLYLSSANVKSEQVRAYYGTLHPLLRVGLSTLIVLDHEAVITDLARRPEDYKSMGLPSNDGSLHLVQRDGYAHAADLRTSGRAFLRNQIVQFYMWVLGFDTLRHVGTADHLHVELPLP